MRKFIWLAAAIIAVAALAGDPSSTRVQQSAEELRASTSCQNATGAAQQTLTFPAPAPNCFWVIDNVDNGSGATTAPAVTILTTTSTGFSATWKGYLTQPASATGVVQNVVFANGLRALAGTAVTFVSNAAVTNITYTLNACGHTVCL
jgi:hypothetical protein